MAKPLVYTRFRYRLASGWTPDHRPGGWINGSYESHRPVTLTTVYRRLRRTWGEIGERVVIVELVQGVPHA